MNIARSIRQALLILSQELCSWCLTSGISSKHRWLDRAWSLSLLLHPGHMAIHQPQGPAAAPTGRRPGPSENPRRRRQQLRHCKTNLASQPRASEVTGLNRDKAAARRRVLVLPRATPRPVTRIASCLAAAFVRRTGPSPSPARARSWSLVRRRGATGSRSDLPQCQDPGLPAPLLVPRPA
jgi:hypothetical protein